MKRTPAVGVMAPPDLAPTAFLPFVRHAESLGFDEVWVTEDLGFTGGFVQATAALGATTSLRVGIGILPAAARNAAFAAMEAAAIAAMFPGRFLLGIGHGMPEWMRQVGAWPRSPLTLLEEYLGAVGAALRGGTPVEPGKYVSLGGFALQNRPTVPPPIVAGVRGPKSLALAGRLADGTLLAEPATPEYVRRALEQIAATGFHYLVTYNFAAVHPDADQARQVVRPALQWVGEPAWAPHIDPLPFAAELQALRARCSSRADFTQRLPAAWIDQLAIVGTPEMARERIAQLHDAGATSAILIPVGLDPLAALDSLSGALR